MIEFKCRKCGAEMESPEVLAGKADRCPQCKVLNRVPISGMLPGAPSEAMAELNQPHVNKKAWYDTVTDALREAIPRESPEAILTCYKCGNYFSWNQDGLFSLRCPNCWPQKEPATHARTAAFTDLAHDPASSDRLSPRGISSDKETVIHTYKGVAYASATAALHAAWKVEFPDVIFKCHKCLMPFRLNDSQSLACPRCRAIIGEDLATIHLQWFKEHSADLDAIASPDTATAASTEQAVIVFQCRRCGAEITSPAQKAGWTGKCASCGELQRVPLVSVHVPAPPKPQYPVPVALSAAAVRTIRSHPAFRAYMQAFVLPGIQHRNGKLLGRGMAFDDEDSLETVYAQRWYAERQAGTPEPEIDAAIRVKEDVTAVPLDKGRVPSSAGYHPEFRAYLEREVWPLVMQCRGLLEYKGDRFENVMQLQADLYLRWVKRRKNQKIVERRKQEAQESEAVLKVLGSSSAPAERDIKERLAKPENPASLDPPDKWGRDKSAKGYTYAGIRYETAVEALAAAWKAENPAVVWGCFRCGRKYPLLRPDGEFSLTCPHCGAETSEETARGALRYFIERVEAERAQAAKKEKADAVAKLKKYADIEPEQGHANGGYVYILINSAMPGVVKVGKTERQPEDRAKELSGVTGIPTPYSVAYDEWFADCSRAEEYIHTLLTANGYRVADNREFFSVPVKVAIKAVVEAKAREEKAGGQGTDKGNV